MYIYVYTYIKSGHLQTEIILLFGYLFFFFCLIDLVRISRAKARLCCLSHGFPVIKTAWCACRAGYCEPPVFLLCGCCGSFCFSSLLPASSLCFTFAYLAQNRSKTFVWCPERMGKLVTHPTICWQGNSFCVRAYFSA